MKRALTKIIHLFMRLWGFKGGSASLMLAALRKDIFNKNIPFSTKLWAWKRGFMGYRVHIYGIDESNYRNHIPDFDYYKLHPINGVYSKWIDDKLTMKYILAPFNEFLPKYYIQIMDGGGIIKLMDCPSDIDPSIDGIVNLLERDGNLALKLLSGSLGKGFYKLTYENKTFYVNTKEISINKLKELIKDLKGYLVTEYILAHKEIRKIYDVTPNTVRVQLIKNINKESVITEAHIKIGSKRSGLSETMSAGTIFVKVDLETGDLLDSKRVINDKLENINFHPDTNGNFNISLPYWKKIKECIHKISSYLPQLNYLGFDIIITDFGFKIIEINSLSSIMFSSYFYPHFKNEYCKKFFQRRFNERPRDFKRVLKILKN